MYAGRTRIVGLGVVALGVAAMTGPACGGRTACFEYSQAEYQANAASCPSQKDAIQNFTDSTCPGPVVSVDGPGSFDGELCCYPVTQDDIVADCGNGGAGGNTGTDETDETELETETDQPIPVDCLGSCAMALQQGTSVCSSISGASADALDALETCLDSMCPEDCTSEIQAGDFDADSICNDCAQASCAAELATCDEN